ncbi:MAG: LPS-assembly protein LptD [Porticoccaceae bacterium]
MGFRQIFRFAANIKADLVADLKISTSRASAAPQAIHGLFRSVFGNAFGNAKAVLIKAMWLLAATSTLTWAEVGPEAADSESPAKNTQWACRVGSEGGWVCEEQDVSGPVYHRPPHRSTARSAAKAKPPADEPRVKVTRNLDWVDESALTAEQKQAASPGCCGAYIEPPRTYEDSDLNPENAPLRASADATETVGNTATLTGDVQVSKGYRQVRSDKAVVDQDASTVLLENNVQFREPNTLLLGDKILINTDSSEIQADNTTFVFHNSGVRGTAATFTRNDRGEIYVDNATYTTCEPGNNTWQLKTGGIKIDPEGAFATARHVRIEVKDVPVLYLPWVRFPVNDQRASGLLFPEFSFGDENGFDFAQPIYLNLAPNYDATVTPRYIQERGSMVELELRHLSQATETVISGAHLWSDDGGDDSDEDANIDPITGKRPHEGEDRWLANVDHNGGQGYPWSTHVDYTKVSDTDYFQDLGNGSLEVSSRTHLRQLASVGYRLKHWNLDVSSVKYQTLIDNRPRQYEQLPRVNFDGAYYFNDSNLALQLDHQYTVFDHADNSFVTGDRLRADYALTWDKRWAWGYFRPSVKTKHLSYNLDDPLVVGGDDNPSVTVPVGEIDTGLYFERDTTLIKGHTQTFEPRLYYLYSDFKEQHDQPNFDTSPLTFSYQQLFRDDRFSGGDRIGDAEQMTLGFTSRLYNSKGVERLRASIGQIFYLDDRYVSLDPIFSKAFIDAIDDPDTLATVAQRDLARSLLNDDSDIAAELYARINDHWRFQSDVLFNDNSDRINKGNVSLRYKNTNDALFNMSYRYTRKNPFIVGSKKFEAHIEQGDVSAMLPVSDNWSLMGRWNYDFTNSRELEMFGGLEYNSCCWRVSVLARRWLDRDDDLVLPEEDLEYDQGIFFQIQLKGLAGTGKQVENILSESIYGYDIPR